MRNLDVLKSCQFVVNISDVDRHWFLIAVDTLTPEVYFGDSNGFVTASYDGIKNADINLRTENVMKEEEDGLIFIEYLLDQQLLFFATKNGILGTYDGLSRQFEYVGCITDGIETVAFGPDFDLLVVVKKNRNLTILNRDFEPIIEETLREISQFGQDAFVTVGWGKKETQFHGSEGKEAAFVKREDVSPCLPWDDRKTRVSWRGDGQYFAVSTVDERTESRVIRIWTREGVHSTTSEIVSGLGQSLCWRPSGNLIASSQQSLATGHSIIFYERNGLRHGEFVLPVVGGDDQQQQQKVLEMAWNRDSNVLAVWLENIASEDENSFHSHLQLWTMGNYHWYLKKCFSFVGKERRIMSVVWDPDNAYCLHWICADGRYFQQHFGWTIARSSVKKSDATVVVVDGAQLLITPLDKCVVPPPFAACCLKLNGFCNFLSFDPTSTKLLCVMSNGDVSLYAKNAKPNDQNEEWMFEKNLRLKNGVPVHSFYHFRWMNDNFVVAAAVLDCGWAIKFFVIDRTNSQLVEEFAINVPGAVYQLTVLDDDGNLLVETDDGALYEIKTSEKTICASSRLPNACSIVEVVHLERKVANNVNSFCVHDKFVLCTTLTHKLYCIPLEKLKSDFTLAANFVDPRNVERGSRLVTAVPKSTKVVLQMPRGNLETIHPRALVLSIVKALLDYRRYKEAILLMKRHRIDMNLIYDHEPVAFMQDIENFIVSVDDAMLFNLFISELKNENVTKTLYASFYDDVRRISQQNSANKKINDVCQALRTNFLKFDLGRRYFTSLLMTFVKTEPSELDNALQTLKNVRDAGGPDSTKLVDEGLRHLLYMVDVNVLTDVALGTYDFDLVLMTLEKSQKDPKEFLPFLNDLKKLEPNYRMYKIDVHLQRYQRALVHLVDCGPDRFDECVQFVKSKQLYAESLQLYPKGSDEYKILCLAYGEFLANQKKFVDSGVFYERGGNFELATESYKRGLHWQMLFALVRRENFSEDRVKELAKNVAPKLKDLKRYSEAAVVFSTFAQDIESALKCYVDGGLFEECLQKIYDWNGPDRQRLLDEIFLSGLNDFVAKLMETLTNRRKSFEQHCQRLAIIRKNKREKFENALAKGDFDDALAEVYSEASSTVTKTSGRSSTRTGNTSKTRQLAKKLERKKFSLKENSAYEDLAILNVLNEIVKQIDTIQAEISPVLRLLVFYDFVEAGKKCQRLLNEFITFIDSKMEEIWPEIVDLPLLPGPLHDNLYGLSESVSADDVVQRIQSGSMPNLLRLEPLMIRPRLRKDISWTIDVLSH